MTKQEFLQQAIQKHGSPNRFSIAHGFDRGNISKIVNGKLPISIAVARAIADDLAKNEDERIKIIGEILK